MRAAALAAMRGLAAHALAGRAGQHPIFCRDPTLLLTPQKGRHAVVDRGVAQYAGIAELHQHRALGVLRVVAGDLHRPHLVGRAIAGAHACAFLSGCQPGFYTIGLVAWLRCVPAGCARRICRDSAHGCRSVWFLRPCGPAAPARCGCHNRPRAGGWRTSGGYVSGYIAATPMRPTHWKRACRCMCYSACWAIGTSRRRCAMCTGCPTTAKARAAPI